MSLNLPNKKLLKIGEAARILGVSIDTLRRWEKSGRIETVRTPGGTRLYPLRSLKSFAGGSNAPVITTPPASIRPAVEPETKNPLGREVNLKSYSTKELLEAAETNPALKDTFALPVQEFIAPVQIDISKSFTISPNISIFEKSVLGIISLCLILVLILAGSIVTNPIATQSALKAIAPKFLSSIIPAPPPIPLKEQKVLAASSAAGFLLVNTDIKVDGAISGNTFNDLTLSANDIGFTISGGTTEGSLTVTSNSAEINQNVSTTASPSFVSLNVTGNKINGFTIPSGTTTFAGTDLTQTLTNKTISGGSNTLTNIANSSLTNSKVTISAGDNLTGGGDVSLGSSITISLKSSPSVSGQVLLADGTASAPGLSFASDTNTGLYRIGADKIALITGGSSTQGITIDSSGNVGLNNASPSYKLDVSGTLNTTGATTLTSTLGVTGATTLSSTLAVTSDTTLTGDLAINGGDLTTTASSFNLLADTTTINIGGGTGANTINIGTGGTTADTITIGNSASSTSLALTSGTGSQTFTSSVVSGTTTTSAFVFADNVLTTGTGLNLSSTSLTSGKLARIAPTFAGSAATGYGLYVDGADSTANANTDYAQYNVLALTGNAAKTGTGLYSTVTSTSTTADTIYAADFLADHNGAIGIGTKSVYGLRAQATSDTPTDTGGTINTYGGYFSATGATGGTHTAYGIYATATGGDTNWAGYFAGNVTLSTGSDILAQGAGTDLGSSSVRFATGYFDNIDATSIAGVLSSGSTNNAAWTINADNATADTEDASLVFERGTTTPNSVIGWDATNDEIDINSSVHITGTTSLATAPLFLIETSANQTTGDIVDITATYAPTAGGTQSAIDLNITNANTTSANTLRSLDLTTGDATALGNTVTNYYSSLASTGNAAKTLTGYYGTVTSSSTTADTLISLDLATDVTGIQGAAGTRSVYGIRNQPSAGAESTAGTLNVYGEYVKLTADVAAGGTVNGYGLYVANGVFDTDGTSAQYGLYIEDQTGADTNYALNIAAQSAATTQAITIGALSGTTANTGINIGAISGASATGTGITIGNISTTGTTNYGLQLGTMTGGTTSNYQISTGILTSATTTTNAQLNLGGIVTTGGTTNYGINVGAMSGTGTTNYGINVAASTATGTTNYGMNIGALSGAATTNYGLYVGAVSGATSNYAAFFGGKVSIGAASTTQDVYISSTNNNSVMKLTSNTDNTNIDLESTGTSGRNYGLVSISGASGYGTAGDFVIVDKSAGGAGSPRLTINATGSVGINDTTPDALFDIDASTTTTAASGLTDTGIHTGTGVNSVAFITANSATSGDILTISSTALTTGTALTLTGPSSVGVTDHFVKVTADVGSASSLLNLNPDFSGSAVTGYGVYNLATDATANANTDYGYYGSLALSGNAAKTGVGLYSTVTTSSTTSDTIIAADLATSATGIIGATTRTNTGLRTQPVSTSANTAGTQNMYGIYSAPSSTLAAGSTENVYGGYFGGTATVASGTINRYGLYVDNASMNTTGTSTQYGLYIASQTSADTNYGVYNAHNGVASGPAEVLAGTWFSGGTATTTKPQLLVEPAGTTSTNWVAGGTGIGVNAASGFAGNLLDLQVAGARKAAITSTGGMNLLGDVIVSGGAIDAGFEALATRDAYVLLGDTTPRWEISSAGNLSNRFAIYNYAANANAITITDSTNFVGINDATPDARLDIDSSATTTADFGITNTGIFTGTGTSSVAQITANSATSGDILTISATALTSGTALTLTGPSSTGVTDHFVKVTADVGSASSLLNLNPDFSGSAVTGYGVYNLATDATANANTDYGYYGSLALSGNAAKTGVGIYSTVTTSSTTSDTIIAADLATSATGIIGATTRTNTGLRTQPVSTSANTAGTQNMYGIYSAPSSTLAAGSTENVYGGYFGGTATVASGTINRYGLYVANASMNTTGTSTQTGLYVESPTGADTNYAAIFAGGNVGIGTTTPGSLLEVTKAAATGTNYSNQVLRLTQGMNSINTIYSRVAMYDDTIYGADIGLVFANTAGNQYNMVFSVNDDTTGNPVEAMRIIGGTSTGYVGIGDTTPDAKLDIDSTSTSGADFLITNTGISTSGTIAGITANSVTTGDILTISSTALTSGTALTLTGPSSTGVTDHFVKVTADVGSASSLLNLNPDFSGSAVTGYGVYNLATDATANANTDYADYTSLALSGNAAKTGYGQYITISSSSTTADTLYGLDITTTHTGNISTGTKSIYGLRSQPSSAGATDTGGTINTYGGYFDATGATGGTSTAYSVYVDASSGADQNYGIYQNGTGAVNAFAGDSSFRQWMGGFESARTNLILNSSFEVDADGDGLANNWATVPTVSAQSLVADPAHGNTAQRVVGGIGALYQNFTLTDNTVYTVSAWVKLVSGAATLYLTGDGSAGICSVAITSSSWTKVQFQCNSGVNTTNQVYVRLDAGSTEVYIDAVQLEQASTPSSFVYTEGGAVARSAGLTSSDAFSLYNNQIINSYATTGTALTVSANQLTTGNVVSISSTATTGGGSGASYLLNLSRSGTNANATHAAYGVYSAITNTGTTSTNVGGYFSASGATNNYGLVVPNGGGRVGIGTVTPISLLDVAGDTGSMAVSLTSANTNANTRNWAICLLCAQFGTLEFSVGTTQGGAPATASPKVVFDKDGNVGIGDQTPDALLDLDSAATTGNIFGILSTTLTTGEVADITATYAPTDGSTNEAIDINLTHTPTTSADVFEGINLAISDGTALANSVYGINSNITLTGNAAKNGIGSLFSVSSSSTTADNIYGMQATTSVTGAIAGGTRSTYGLYSAPASTAANSAGTSTMYGSYLTPSSTGPTTGTTAVTNVYGEYITSTATHAADAGTINQYGLYVANGTSSTNGTSTKYGVYIESPTGADTNWALYTAGGKVQFTCTTSATTWTTSQANPSCSDYAEVYETDDLALAAGDIITLDKSSGGKVNRSGSSYQKEIIGIYSTSPGMLIGPQGVIAAGDSSNLGFGKVPVALTGRVPVKVSTENGAIEKGDFLTSSSIPGVAMKATKPGQVVGKALEEFAGDSGQVTGKIMVFVNVSFADPGNFLASLSLDNEGNLIAPKIKTDKLIISTNINMARSDNKGLIAYTQGTDTANQPSYNIDILASLKNLESKVVEVADSESTSSARLADVQSSVATSSAALADLKSQINSLAGQIATSSSTPRNDTAELNLTPPSAMTIATQSAVLADLKVTSEATFSAKLAAYDLSVSNEFKSLGTASLGNTTIAGTLSVDGLFSITGGNTIDAIGTLFLQKSPLATNIDIFAGKVLIDNTGKLTAQIISAKEYLGVSGTTVGTGKILAGTKTVTINSTLVKDTSRILITPTTETSQSLSVVAKTAQTSFTVSVPTEVTADISFDWFIINEAN